MELKLPELGEGVHEGELIKWNVKPGDTVKEDQVLAEIMTDKATVELPSHIAGKVTEVLAKEGETVHVGQVLLRFEGAGAAKSEAPKSAPTAAPGVAPTPTPAPMAAKGPSSSPASSASAPVLTLGGEVTAAPAARRFARESGVDITQVHGTGPDGRVMKDDIEKFVSGGAGATKAGAPTFTSGYAARAMNRGPVELETRIPFRGLRKKISEKMHLSKSTAAHFTYVEECDATNLVELRAKAKEIGAAHGVKVTYLPFIMKAMVAALKKYPILNSELDEANGVIIQKNYYNIALSVQTDDGLMAPVVKDVANKTILELAADIEGLAHRARTKKLTNEDNHGGTITLTNAGTIGGLFATPVINYPEVAILGFNKIDRKPVVKKIGGVEQIVIRDWTLFSLSLDHRIVDGAIGAEFTKLFISYLENPALLIMDSL
jgi:pyruvate dehydrogenase E2 component (dihydrolipoamide acetyltransferase)